MSSQTQGQKLTASRSSAIVTSARASQASQSSDGSWRAPKTARYSAQYLFPASDYTVLDNINAKYRVRQILTQPNAAPGIPRSASTDQLGFRYYGKQPNMTQIQVQAARNQLDAFRGVQEQAFGQIYALIMRLGCASTRSTLEGQLAGLRGQLQQIRQSIRQIGGEIGDSALSSLLEKASEAAAALNNPTGRQGRALEVSQKAGYLAVIAHSSTYSCFYALQGVKSVVALSAYSVASLLDAAAEKAGRALAESTESRAAASAEQRYIAQLESQLRTLQIAPEKPPHGLTRGEDGGTLNAALQLIFHSAALIGAVRQQKNHFAESLAAVAGEAWRASYYQLLYFVGYITTERSVSKHACGVQALLEAVLATLSCLASPSSNYFEEIAYDADKDAAFERFRRMCERRQNSLIQGAVSFYVIDELSCSCGAASYRYRRLESIAFAAIGTLDRALDAYFAPRDSGAACSCGSRFSCKTSIMTAPKQLILFCTPKYTGRAPESIELSRFFHARARARYILDAGVRCGAGHAAFARVGSKWWACDGPSVEALPGPQEGFCCASFSLDE